MALAFNKSVLKRERGRLARFQRFLPSLDLKRKQLVAHFNRARKTLADRIQEIDGFVESQESLLALLGGARFELTGLVQVQDVLIKEENVLGVRLPALETAKFQVAEYSTLARPFWVDLLALAIKNMALLHINRQLEQERVKRLECAVRRITQRVNLFEKILIPSAQRNIQRISVYLADAERAAVVRAKIAKAKRRSAT